MRSDIKVKMYYWLLCSTIFLASVSSTETVVRPLTDTAPIQSNTIQRIVTVLENKPSDETRALKKVFLSNRSITCNDGSQAGFYLRKSHTSKKWIIFLEGGWYCYDNHTCRNRWLKLRHLMTSSQWPETRDVSGILSPVPEENPHWYNANHVFVPYCTSDSWSGTRMTKEGMFTFMGALVVQQVILDLIPLGLDNSTSLLLAGSSAGGTGAMLNVDPVRELLHTVLRPRRPPTVRAVCDSGWFLDRAPYREKRDVEDVIRETRDMYRDVNRHQEDIIREKTDVKRDLEDVSRERRDINRDQEDIVRKKRDVNRDWNRGVNRDVNRDQKDIIREKRDVNRDLEDVIRQRRDVNRDQEDIFRDKRDVNRDQEDIIREKRYVNKDQKDIFREKRDMNRDVEEVTRDVNRDQEDIFRAKRDVSRDQEARAVEAISKGMDMWRGRVPKRCGREYKGEEWRCYFGYRLYPTLKSPLFVFQWLFDEAQMTVDNVGAPVTKQQWDYIHKMGNALRQSFENVTAVFAPSCISHSVLTKRDWQLVKVNDVSIAEALHCWEQQPLRRLNVRQNTKNSPKISDGPAVNKGLSVGAKISRTNDRRKKQDGGSTTEPTNKRRRRKKHKNRDRDRNLRKNKRHKGRHNTTNTTPSPKFPPLRRRSRCHQRHLERCSWPQCNHSCPKLHNPFTGEEMDFIELLKSFGLDMESVATALGIDMQTLNNMDPGELLNLLTQQAN